MDYTQNSKISQVSEQTLILGVDVGSEVHYARSLNWRGIRLLQPLSVDLLDDVLSEPGDLRNCLVRQAKRQQISGVLLQLAGDVVVFGLERDLLHLAVTAGRAIITAFVEADA